MHRLRLLITGINGMIGTVRRNALQDKHDACGMDREGEFSERVLSGNVADYKQIAAIVPKFSPLDAIIHLAANPDPSASWEDVLSANMIGTRNVFEAVRELQVRRVVYASSNHVTGAYEGFDPKPDPPKISPQDPIRPDSDYGVSKAFGEAVASYYSSRWGVEAICLRIGAALGNDDPTRDERNRKIWLSQRDLIQLVEKSLTANVVFGNYYGISNNKGAYWDITSARMELGFEPVDDGSTR